MEMEITPSLGILLMMNNYFHDVATALLAVSAFVLYAIVRVEEKVDAPAGRLFFLCTYDKMVGFFRFGLWWIFLGGIPRVLFYTRFEWSNAAGKGQVPALAVKHILMAGLVGWGFYAWRRLKIKADTLRASLPEDSRRSLEGGG